MALRSCPNPSRPGRQAAFTLTELLVAAVVGSITVITAVTVLGPHLRSNQRMEAYTRLQERWIRVAYLLDTEVMSARTVTVGTNSLTLSVPIRDDNDAVVIRTVTYSLTASGDLQRNGPPIDKWGRVDPTVVSTPQVLVDGIAASGFTPSLAEGGGSTPLSLSYAITLVDRNSDTTYTGRSSVARGKADCDSLEFDGGDCD